jgi:hypothetical protein
LNNGEPWLVEHTLGQGRVLLASSAFDLRDGNLPNRPGFVPLIHGLVYRLCEDSRCDLNHRPGRQIAVHLPLLATDPPPTAPAVQLTRPDAEPAETVSRWDRGMLAVDVASLSMPGIYRATLPDAPAGKTKEPADKTKDPVGRSFPVAVSADPAESDMQWLSASDVAAIAPAVELHALNEFEDLQAIAAGRAYGVELWRSLMFLAFLCVVGEVLLTWWISLQRIPETQQTVDFASRTTSVAFLDALEKLHASPANRESEPVVDLLDIGE